MNPGEPKSSSSRPPMIMSGIGIGKLKIGDSPETVLATMKASGSISDYATEHKVFNDFNYVPEHYLQFLLGFDSVMVFHEDDGPTYPVFKIYFKNNAAVFIIVSSYGTDVFD